MEPTFAVSANRMLSPQSAGIPRGCGQLLKATEEPGHQLAKASGWGQQVAKMGYRDW